MAGIKTPQKQTEPRPDNLISLQSEKLSKLKKDVKAAEARLKALEKELQEVKNLTADHITQTLAKVREEIQNELNDSQSFEVFATVTDLTVYDNQVAQSIVHSAVPRSKLIRALIKWGF